MATSPVIDYLEGLDYTLFQSKEDNKFYIVYYPNTEKIGNKVYKIHDGTERKYQLAENEYFKFKNKTIEEKTKYSDLVYTLPPVEVVAKAPAKNSTNKKMLVVGLLVVVCVLAVLATSPKKRKR